MNKRIEQKEQRRKQILDVALDLFIQKGYAATKISDIAQAAGMSVGLLFHYFESKEHLYGALVEIGKQGPESVFQTLGNVAPIQFFEQASEMILGAMRESAFTAKMFVLMNHAFSSYETPASAREIMGEMNYFHATVPLIMAGQADGSIRDGDPLALSAAFWTAIQGAAQAMALYGIPCPQSEWMVDIIRRKK